MSSGEWLYATLSFEVHEAIVLFLFDAYQKVPQDGYAKVTLTQMAMCDREIHVRLSELCREGFSHGRDESLPLDRHVPEVLEMRSVEQLVLQRLKGKNMVPPLPNPPGTGKRAKKGPIYIYIYASEPSRWSPLGRPW